MMSRFPTGLQSAALLLALASLCIASAVDAHIGAGAGDTDLLPHPGDASAVLLEAPWGLVVSSAEGGYDWVCHEVLSNGVAELPEFEISRDGVMFGVAGLLTGTAVPNESLYRSTDDGCSWEAVSGTTGELVQDAGFDPEDGSIALAVTANPVDPDDAIRNSILRSVDGGASFAEVQGYDGRVFREVRFGPGGVAYALAVDQEPLAAVLLRSEDGGLTWAEKAIPDETLETPAFGVIAAIDPGDANEVWLTFDGNAEDGALRTADGGDSFEALDLPASLVLDVTLLPDGGGWLVGDARQLWSSADRVVWTLHETAPQVWGGAWVDGGLRLAVNTLAHDEALVRTEEGAQFETLLTTLDLQGPLECPAGTTVADVCEPLWDNLYRVLTLMRPQPSGGDDDDSASPVEPGACDGCGANTLGGAGAGWTWALLLLGLSCARSRRRVGGGQRPASGKRAVRP
ncbi:MAG: hypothetical protein KDA24_20595 [Deltaproteobacteria bacterium]|nr:hypothetical protein [Deltaproteobacteria bacterium]